MGVVSKREPMANQYGFACVLITSNKFGKPEACVQFTWGKDELHLRFTNGDAVQVVAGVGATPPLDLLMAVLALGNAVGEVVHQDCTARGLDLVRRMLKREHLTARQMTELAKET